MPQHTTGQGPRVKGHGSRVKGHGSRAIAMAQPFLQGLQPEHHIRGYVQGLCAGAMCQGQLLPLNQSITLFSLVGTQFAGDGPHNFALPDFRGTAACSQGQRPDLSARSVAQNAGQDAVTLSENQMPTQAHAATVYAQPDATKRHGTPTSGDAITSPHGDGRTGRIRHRRRRGRRGVVSAGKLG